MVRRLVKGDVVMMVGWDMTGWGWFWMFLMMGGGALLLVLLIALVMRGPTVGPRPEPSDTPGDPKKILARRFAQ